MNKTRKEVLDEILRSFLCIWDCEELEDGDMLWEIKDKLQREMEYEET